VYLRVDDLLFVAFNGRRSVSAPVKTPRPRSV